MEIHFLKICKSSTTFQTSGGVEGTLDLVNRKDFLFIEVCLIAPVIATYTVILDRFYFLVKG